MNALAFSTLGCPDWDMERILKAAHEYGYTALELRGYLQEMDIPKSEPFLPHNRAHTLRRMTEANLSICCVASSGIVAQANHDHVRSHIELAHDLNAPFVRVFGGKLPDSKSHADGVEEFAATLRTWGDFAQAAGVGLVLETHDSFSTGESVAELLQSASHPAVFSLWDLHHPFRQGETPEVTYRFLAPTLRHLHVKDSANGVYTLMGEGDIPLPGMLDLALKGGYDGAICLEWEKRWHPNLLDPEIAFPQYAQKLRAYLSQQD